MSGVKAPKGLYGLSVADTRIGKSDSSGALVYRGYSIGEIAANAGFEETAYLVLHGGLPAKKRLEEFSSGLLEMSRLDPRVVQVMRELGPESHPIDVMRTATSALGSLDGLRSVPEQQESLEAKMAVLAANCARVPKGEGARLPDDGLSFSDRFLGMLSNKEATEYDRWAFERAMIFYLEHDLNASTYTVRVVASTRADPYAAAAAGLAALKGPLHGGANEEAMRMFLEIGDESKAGEYLDKALAEGTKVPGFGHRVYKKFDPRARLCKEYLKEMSRRRGDDRLFRLCDALEARMWEKKQIPPNLDYYAAPIFYLLGIEVPLYTPIFAASRVFGWMAHYDEQLEESRLIRPDATYIGPVGLKYVPVGSRAASD